LGVGGWFGRWFVGGVGGVGGEVGWGGGVCGCFVGGLGGGGWGGLGWGGWVETPTLYQEKKTWGQEREGEIEFVEGLPSKKKTGRVGGGGEAKCGDPDKQESKGPGGPKGVFGQEEDEQGEGIYAKRRRSHTKKKKRKMRGRKQKEGIIHNTHGQDTGKKREGSGVCPKSKRFRGRTLQKEKKRGIRRG